MNAADIMTRDTVTVTPETPVPDLVRMLLARGISGAPVVDKDGVLVGMVTEGDLVRRAELGTERHARRLGGLLHRHRGAGARVCAQPRPDGQRRDDAGRGRGGAATPPLGEIADLMEGRRVRRVPVVQDGKVVGIVSRANLLRAWASLSGEAKPASVDDTAIRNALLAELSHQAWSRRPENSVVVDAGVVHLWGLAGTEEEKRALELAATRTPGVKSVESHIVVLTAEPYPLLLGA